MIGIRGRRAVQGLAVAVASFYAAPAPAAFGQLLPLGGACSDVPGGDGQGAVGSPNTEICNGTGVVFVGPQIGQIATVIGPTIIGPSNVGAVNTSAGDIAGASGAVPLVL